MARRRASDAAQFDLFTAARPVSGPAAHAGIEAWVSEEVAELLHEAKLDGRSRGAIAGEMSEQLGEEISLNMLNAYASPGRDQHNISFGRAIALMAVTQNPAMIEEAVRRLGGSVLWGEEINAARLGHLLASRARLDSEIKLLTRGGARPIERKKRA